MVDVVWWVEESCPDRGDSDLVEEAVVGVSETAGLFVGNSTGMPVLIALVMQPNPG